MKPNVPGPFFFRLSAAIITIAVIAAAAAAQSLKETDWPNITPAEIAMKSPLVDPNADAEAIFGKSVLMTRRLPQFHSIIIFASRFSPNAAGKNTRNLIFPLQNESRSKILPSE